MPGARRVCRHRGRSSHRIGVDMATATRRTDLAWPNMACRHSRPRRDRHGLLLSVRGARRVLWLASSLATRRARGGHTAHPGSLSLRPASAHALHAPLFLGASGDDADPGSLEQRYDAVRADWCPPRGSRLASPLRDHLRRIQTPRADVPSLASPSAGGRASRSRALMSGQNSVRQYRLCRFYRLTRRLASLAKGSQFSPSLLQLMIPALLEHLCDSCILSCWCWLSVSHIAPPLRNPASSQRRISSSCHRRSRLRSCCRRRKSCPATCCFPTRARPSRSSARATCGNTTASTAPAASARASSCPPLAPTTPSMALPIRGRPRSPGCICRTSSIEA